MEKASCRLCFGQTQEFHQEPEREFVLCPDCGSVMLLPKYFLDPIAEENRYRLHNNDIHDERYQKFVAPIVTAVKQFFPPASTGLDYGCGPGPVAAVQLQNAGYKVALYDPFFEDHPGVLEQQYDFIICCEVMEHFHNPNKEFKLLKNLLKPGGMLFCKTSLYSRKMSFAGWYYKNDPTHVFLYTEETLQWIRTNFGFSELRVHPKLIVFKN